MSTSILLTVHDRPGVLARVAGQIARHGYNIVSMTADPQEVGGGMSQMTIVVGTDEKACGQLVKQLHKLIDVRDVHQIPG
jgi:acetolactate synthase-1/3 small subunit